MIETASFGEWMAQRRKTLDLTQRELAAQTNCALATIKKIELDERRPSRELAAALANVLRIPAHSAEIFVDCARGLHPVDALRTMQTAAANIRPGAPFLPLSAIPLVGRDAELAEITRLLAQPDCRFLTLVGAGGVGKTRLALETAYRQRERLEDGIAFVPLAAVVDAAVIPMSIAQSLNLPLSGSADTQLFAYLRDNVHFLLFLDRLGAIEQDNQIPGI